MTTYELAENQKLIGRTPYGRNITKKALQLVDQTLATPETERNNLLECSNCGIILHQDLFAEGCPNCLVSDIRKV